MGMGGAQEGAELRTAPRSRQAALAPRRVLGCLGAPIIVQPCSWSHAVRLQVTPWVSVGSFMGKAGEFENYDGSGPFAKSGQESDLPEQRHPQCCLLARAETLLGYSPPPYGPELLPPKLPPFIGPKLEDWLL